LLAVEVDLSKLRLVGGNAQVNKKKNAVTVPLISYNKYEAWQRAAYDVSWVNFCLFLLLCPEPEVVGWFRLCGFLLFSGSKVTPFLV
jgi:hypothetical protein